MSEWLRYGAAAVCGGAVTLGAAYVWLVWYLNRNCQM